MNPLRERFDEMLGPIDPVVPEQMRPHIRAIRRSGTRRRIVGFVISSLFYGCLLIAATFLAWVYAQVTDRTVPSLTKVEIVSQVTQPGGDLAMRVTPHFMKLCEGKAVFRAFDRQGNIINQSETEWSFPLTKVSFSKTVSDEPFIRKLRISRDAVESRLGEDGRLAEDARLRIERKFYCNGVQKWFGWPIVEMPKEEMHFAIGGSKKDEGK